MSDSVTASIKILDKEFKIRCAKEDYDALMASEKYLNQQITDVKNTGVIGTDKIVILAALNITRDLLSERNASGEFSDLSAGLKSILNQLDDTLQIIKR